MRFETIAITGGQANTPDPRTNPGDVPAQLIKDTPTVLSNTDSPPTVAAITLEGTATQTVTVQMFALDEPATANQAMADDPSAGASARRFYAAHAAGVVVTVGATTYFRAIPGKVYYRLTSAPAANATLKIGFAAGAP
jgi:hypothetical protein